MRNTTRKLLALAFATQFLTACEVGQGIKTLGAKSSTSTADATTDSDTFSVTVAYRDDQASTATLKRTVAIQGVLSLPSANFVNQCGNPVSTCTCDFYRNSADTSPVSASSVGISSQNNSISCVIPSTSFTDAQVAANAVTFVRLRRTDATNRATGLVAIKTSSQLTIDDVLGPTLAKNRVRGVYKYSCTRTFFEGEGVTANQISCTANQHLGLITADYNYYFYRSGIGESTLPGTTTTFSSDICKRTDFTKSNCSSSLTDLRFGLYRDQVAPFTVAISMTRAPDGDNLVSNYGYAALPDNNGNCPAGLVKVRPWLAQPASLVQTVGTYPTNFLNSNNGLNNTVVDDVNTIPANFVVYRSTNATQCNGGGDCTLATFNSPISAESVAYVGQTPILCVINKNLLSGLF